MAGGIGQFKGGVTKQTTPAGGLQGEESVIYSSALPLCHVVNTDRSSPWMLLSAIECVRKFSDTFLKPSYP